MNNRSIYEGNDVYDSTNKKRIEARLLQLIRDHPQLANRRMEDLIEEVRVDIARRYGSRD